MLPFMTNGFLEVPVGEYPEYASERGTQGVTLCFINTTTRLVSIDWITFEGETHTFRHVAPNHRICINSFHNHRWIAYDLNTSQKLLLNKSFPYTARVIAPDSVPPTFVYVTAPVYTLKDIALSAIISSIRYTGDIERLGLPVMLCNDLYNVFMNTLRH